MRHLLRLEIAEGRPCFGRRWRTELVIHHYWFGPCWLLELLMRLLNTATVPTVGRFGPLANLGLIEGRFTLGCLFSLIDFVYLILNLTLGLFVDLFHILRDQVCRAQVPFSEIRSQPVTFNSFVVFLQKLLLDPQIVIRDR